MRKELGVNTNPNILTNRNKVLGYVRLRPVRIALAVACIVVLATVVYAFWFAGSNGGKQIATGLVQQGPLVISVVQSGTVQNRERAVVKSEVEGTTTILFLVSEGVHVEKGDLLVDLDSSKLVDERKQQQIVVINSEAAFIHARENLAVTTSQADSDVAKADLTQKFAEQDLKKYLEGDYPRELQKAEADINIAKEELQRATDKLDWSKRLADEGYITRTELKADELAAKRAQINLDLADSALDLLKQYTHQRSLDQLKSDVEQAKEALNRTKRKARADVTQAKADLKAKQAEYEREKTKLEEINDQIAKCRITAPMGGMVVYATTGQVSHHQNVAPLEEGQQVRERQELIYVPTDAAMMAEVKIHEASLRKVKIGMPVRITVDAVPGQVFWGRVAKIGLLPDAQMTYMNPDLKVYNTQIDLDDDAGGLRPGMNCRAEIIVEQYADALYVPVQCVVRVGGKTVAYVQTSSGVEQRQVNVGLDNNRMIRVIEGLKEGESVLLAPPLAPSAVAEGIDQGTGQIAVPSSTTMPGQANVASGETAQSHPSSRPAFDPSKLRGMSKEERRKFLDTLTPEQREEMQKRAPGQGGSRQRPSQPEGQ
jgi:HlyD family secretion protein